MYEAREDGKCQSMHCSGYLKIFLILRSGVRIRSLRGIVKPSWLEVGRVGKYRRRMTKCSPFRYYKTSPEIIRLTVMLQFVPSCFSKRLNLLSYARQRCEQAVSKTSDLTTICVDLTQMTA